MENPAMWLALGREWSEAQMSGLISVSLSGCFLCWPHSWASSFHVVQKRLLKAPSFSGPYSQKRQQIESSFSFCGSPGLSLWLSSGPRHWHWRRFGGLVIDSQTVIEGKVSQIKEDFCSQRKGKEVLLRQK